MMVDMKSDSNAVKRELKKISAPEKARASAWFFKTGKGEYGYGDVFYGVTVPEQRKIAGKFADLPLAEIGKLLKNKVHECRLTALFILVGKFKKAKTIEQNKIAKFYIAHKKYINNWDLVDSSAPYILGRYFLDKDKEILYKLARSKSLWDRRIAVLSAGGFIRENRFEDVLRISEILLGDKHDLVHKAVGWMLREVGKRSAETEEKFLKKHAGAMPRTMLRYAIEKFSSEKRKYYLHLTRHTQKRRERGNFWVC